MNQLQGLVSALTYVSVVDFSLFLVELVVFWLNSGELCEMAVSCRLASVAGLCPLTCPHCADEEDASELLVTPYRLDSDWLI